MYLPQIELYIKNDPAMGAFTTGATQYFVVLHSGLIDQMNESEIMYVLGHELGHVKCSHVLYHQVAETQLAGATALGQYGFNSCTSFGTAGGRHERAGKRQ